MSIFLPGLPDLPTGLYFLSVDNSQKDETVYTIGRHLRHSPPDFEMIRGLDIFYSGQPVSVPQDHGRLIDADALYEDCALDHNYEVAATTTRINEYMQLKIDAAPTIIPAEPCNSLSKPCKKEDESDG